MAFEKKKLLDIKGVTKSFSGVTVFSDFDFDIYSGEVHCICGENGAGKSTFIKILSGVYHPDCGSITITGTKVGNRLNPALSMKLGIQTIYQEHTLMQNMTVMENLFIGKEITKNGIMDMNAMNKQTLEILGRIGVTNISPFEKVRSLGTAQQKFVEIAKAFVKDAKIIIMDEPTASFGSHEIEQLLNVIENLKSNGIAIIYISHHLEEVFHIADRVTVIRDGRKISTYDKKDIDGPAIIRDMVGRDASLFYKREPVESGDVVMEVKNLSGPGVDNVSFNVRRGEILGFAGLVGAGRTEMASLLFGCRNKTSGEIFIDGKKIGIKTPDDAIKAGMCYITEDRQLNGLFLKQSISLNTILVNSVKRNKRFMSPRYDKKITDEYVGKLRIACKNTDEKVCFLSGGNQQKVILSKWFCGDGDVFIFDEPTRGVDIGAKESIYKLMIDLCKQGKAIIMISSDMPEVIAISDRVIIMSKGTIKSEIQKEEINSENILSLALGGNI